MSTHVKLGSDEERRSSDKLKGLLWCDYPAHVHVHQLDGQVEGLVVELKVLLYLYQPVHQDGSHAGCQVLLACHVVVYLELRLWDNICTSLAQGKLGLMHVCKVSSQISLCSLHSLIRDDTFRFFGFFRFNSLFLDGKCHPWLAHANLGQRFTHMLTWKPMNLNISTDRQNAYLSFLVVLEDVKRIQCHLYWVPQVLCVHIVHIRWDLCLFLGIILHWHQILHPLTAVTQHKDWEHGWN